MVKSSQKVWLNGQKMWNFEIILKDKECQKLNLKMLKSYFCIPNLYNKSFLIMLSIPHMLEYC